jgi:hypothetical protein
VPPPCNIPKVKRPPILYCGSPITEIHRKDGTLNLVAKAGKFSAPRLENKCCLKNSFKDIMCKSCQNCS